MMQAPPPYQYYVDVAAQCFLKAGQGEDYRAFLLRALGRDAIVYACNVSLKHPREICPLVDLVMMVEMELRQ